MDLNENIKNNVQRLRRERNITQEVLAAALEISVQAISKWETGVSLPDIMQLPRIAKFFGVTIDYLFYNEGVEETVISGELPNDDILRVIQFRGNKMLGMDRWEKDKTIDLKLPDMTGSNLSQFILNVEIWGNTNIEGNIGGYAEAGGYLNCGNIGGYAEAGGYLNCGNIGGYTESGGSINCGNIGGYVEIGGSLNCGNISGNVECAGKINCSDILSQVECEGDIRCRSIQGNVVCKGNITYEK